jgi:hypothetical protein
VENTGWEGRGEVWCHIQCSEGGSPPPVSIKDRSSGLGEQVQLCNDAYEIYGVPYT